MDPSQKNGTPDLSGMLSTLLSNPALMENIKQTLQASMPSEGAAAAPSESNATTGEATPASASIPQTLLPADGLATVLSNPDLMAKLPQMMSMLRPMLQNAGSAPMGPSGSKREKSSEDCRNELLCALKPFLSPERRNAVDAMLRISQLGTVIKQIK